METMIMTGLTLVLLGIFVFGIFVVTKRQDLAIDLQKEMVQLLKRVEENTKGN